VAMGLGIGIALAIPGKVFPATLRALPMSGFPSVVVGATWRGRKTFLIETFLTEIQRRARQLG